MNKFFDKSKIYNYIVAGIFLITALMFIKNMSLFIWNFDIFNKHQVLTFLRYLVKGKSFSSGKQLSFLITFVGALCITVSGVLIAMQLNFMKVEENSENTKNSEDINKAVEIIKTNEASTQKPAEKTIENQKENTSEPENKFAMYENKNLMPKNEEVTIPAPEVIENNKNEDEERAKLQSKIREIMRKMKERKEEEEEETTKKKPSTSNKLLSKFETQKPLQAERIDMNFKNISDEENAVMEHDIISAGFKLLSEIRIGSTGIDYLGVAKDKLVVVQLDTTDGNWFASEDKVEGNETPVWFSEAGNKISPVARALEAKENIKNLLDKDIDLPIETVACLTNSNVVNYEEFKEKWDDMGVKVVKLYKPEEDDLSEIQTLSDIYPVQSQSEVPEEMMNKIISILEKAEIPE